MRTEVLLSPLARGARAPQSRGGLAEVSKTTAATTLVHPKTVVAHGDVHQVQSHQLFLALHLGLVWKNAP